jgi:hypothetical protein
MPRSGDDVVMMGFPVRLAQPFGANFMVFRAVEYVRVVDPGSRLLSGFDQTTQFLVDYPSAEDYDPAGFSGSVLWARKEEPGLWLPNPRPVGMVQGYYSRSKLLYATSSIRLREFLTTEHPDV